MDAKYDDDDDDDDGTLGAVWEQDHRPSREGKDLRRTRWPPGKRLATFLALTTRPLLIVFNIITETKMATNHHHCCLFQPSSRSTEGIEQQWEGGRMHLEEIRKSWKEELNFHASVLDLTFYFFHWQQKNNILFPVPNVYCFFARETSNRYFFQEQEHDTCSWTTDWDPSCQGSFLVKVVTWVANHLGLWYYRSDIS